MGRVVVSGHRTKARAGEAWPHPPRSGSCMYLDATAAATRTAHDAGRVEIGRGAAIAWSRYPSFACKAAPASQALPRCNVCQAKALAKPVARSTLPVCRGAISTGNQPTLPRVCLASDGGPYPGSIDLRVGALRILPPARGSERCVRRTALLLAPVDTALRTSSSAGDAARHPIHSGDRVARARCDRTHCQAMIGVFADVAASHAAGIVRVAAWQLASG